MDDSKNRNDWKEKAASYALGRIYVYEPRIPKAIVDSLGSASELFLMDSDSLDTALGPFNRHKDLIRKKSLEQWADEMENACRNGWKRLSYCDGAFPEQLWACEDSPLGFFVKSSGDCADIFGRECISVIGTRDLSSYGEEWCRLLVESLSSSTARPTVVSGLALGVDIVAHRAALDCGLPTIAVMATGTDTIYPRQHLNYAERIAASPPGALLTEHPPGAEITAVSFLCRNRIIAGLSRATVLVESRLKGGGMSTARMASSYSREVYAIPGRNDDLRSQGCNALIHSHLAEPLIDCGEFLKSLGYKPAPGRKMSRSLLRESIHGKDEQQTGRMMKLVLAIREHRDSDAQALAEMTGMGMGSVLADLCLLENDGIVCSDLLGRFSIKKN